MTKQSLGETQSLFLTVFQLIPTGAGISRLSDSVLVDVNGGFERILGHMRADVIGRSTAELNLYADPEERANIVRVVREHGLVHDREVKVRTKAGTTRDMLLSARTIDLGGEPCLLTVFHDITERKQMEAMLRDSEERYRALTQSAKDGIISADQAGQIVSWNGGAQAIFGYTDDEVIGQPLTVLMPDRYRVLHGDGLKRFMTTGESRVIGKTIELAGRRKDGIEFPLELSLATWRTPAGTFFTGILRDISERKHAEETLHRQNMELAAATERLHNLSLTDELTGLNNRRGFLTLAAKHVKLARRARYSMSLLFMDVDGLKQINDNFGHHAGDAALTVAARLLRDVFRESDVLGRIGGDEFAVLAVNAAEHNMEVVRTRLQSSLDVHNAQSGDAYVLALSVGEIEVRPDAVQSIEELLAEADVAMYANKLRKKQQGAS